MLTHHERPQRIPTALEQIVARAPQLQAARGGIAGQKLVERTRKRNRVSQMHHRRCNGGVTSADSPKFSAVFVLSSTPAGRKWRKLGLPPSLFAIREGVKEGGEVQRGKRQGLQAPAKPVTRPGRSGQGVIRTAYCTQPLDSPPYSSHLWCATMVS